jgi:hypothetical protein
MLAEKTFHAGCSKISAARHAKDRSFGLVQGRHPLALEMLEGVDSSLHYSIPPVFNL